MEPITAAVAALGALKQGVKVGKELHDMASDIGKLWGGIDAARGAHTKKKKGQILSVEEEALQTLLHYYNILRTPILSFRRASIL